MPRATGQPALKKSFLRGLTRSKLQALAKVRLNLHMGHDHQ